MNAWFKSVVALVQQEWPYFIYTMGRDHIFVFPYGHGPLRFKTWSKLVRCVKPRTFSSFRY